MRALDLTTSFAVTLLRLGAGRAVGAIGRRPERPLELFEFEACPFCRKVREALSVLDLEAMVYPCPKRGQRYRRRVRERGGKEQFPYLVDPNAGVELYESDDIVRHLFERYGDGRVPLGLALGPLGDLGSIAAGAPRAARGALAAASRAPEQPLELWSFEASPFCRLVRERLCELELPYRLHNVAAGSPSRSAFPVSDRKLQVPYLRDPNTGIGSFESADIVRYLDEQYAVP
jgi:glutathione S-transferase